MNAPKLDGDSMAERDYSKEYAREKEQQKRYLQRLHLSSMKILQKRRKRIVLQRMPF